MAGYGWSLRHRTTSGQRKSSSSPQIACRICDHVFASTQALVDHIKCHMVDDDIVSRRRRYDLNFISSQTEAFAKPLNKFSYPTFFPETRPLSLSGSGFPSLRERNTVFRPTPHNLVSLRLSHQQQVSLLDMSSNTVSQKHKYCMMYEPIITDRTMPFLQKLEKPLSNGTGLRKRSRSDADILDLTLKL